MYIVYKITNIINNKIYFGYTSQTLKARFNKHLHEKRRTLITASLNKYRPCNFVIEQLFTFETIHEAKTTETFLIAFFQTNALRYPNNKGLNMTDGGEGCTGYRHSKDLRKKWSEERKGALSPRSKFTESNDPLNKKIYQFTKMGKFIQSFPSVKIAGKETNNNPANISKCCHNVQKTCGGFIFQYESAFKKRNLTPKHNRMCGDRNPRSKRCFLYDRETNCWSEYQSLGEIARLNNINYSTIKKSAQTSNWICSGRFLVSYQPHFEYEH